MRSACVACCLACVVSCGGSDSTGPPTPSARGIQFVSGAGLTDSADAILTQPLLVEVRDSTGRLAPINTLVRFSGVQRASVVDFEARIQAPGSQQFQPLAIATTNASGRVSVVVQLGLVAGSARVVVFAPTLGVTDTARYTVVPGAAFGVNLAPGDTTIYVGRSYILRGGVVDRGGNLRNDALTWTASGGGVSVSSSGLVTASAFGHYTVVARLRPDYAIGVNVSVVPQARIVGSLGTSIVAIDIDGNNRQTLAQVSLPSGGPRARWLLGTNVVIYTHQEGPTQVLLTVDESRVVRRFLSSPPQTLSHHAEPAPTANGQWVYFSAQDTRCSSVHFCLYRARVDGTAAELLGNPNDFPSGAREPAPSPDGSKVAYVSFNGVSVIKVFDVASRTVSSWSVPGRYPAWSPSGTDIAFMPNGGGPFMLMNPDGTGVRALTSIVSDEEPLSWSADGRWIMARLDPLGVVLIDATSGDAIPVRLVGAVLAAPSFK